MADLGSVGVLNHGHQILWGQSISGSVFDDNNDHARRSIAAYNRETLGLSAKTLSDELTGAYLLHMPVNQANTLCFVVCLDDAAGESYNALAFDKVMPA